MVFKFPPIRSRKKPDNQYWLLYRGVDRSEGVYRFDAHSFERASKEDIPDGAMLFSATAEDLRMDHPKQRVSSTRLERLAGQESGEGGRMRIIKQPKPASIWFTRATRLKGFDFSVYPLAATMEGMLLKAGGQKPALVGVSFGANPETPDLMLFVAFNETEQVQILPALMPESVEEATTSAQHDARLPENAGVMIFTQADLWAACAKAKPYPTQEAFFGLDPKMAAFGFAGVSALAALGVGGWWGYEAWSYNVLQEEYQSVTAQRDGAKQRAVMRIEANPDGLSVTLRENWSKALDEAAALWKESGKMETDLEKREAVHTLIFQVRMAGLAEHKWLPQEKVLEVMRDKSLPEGCQLKQIVVTGNTNEIRTKYLCSHPGDDLLGVWK